MGSSVSKFKRKPPRQSKRTTSPQTTEDPPRTSPQKELRNPRPQAAQLPSQQTEESSPRTSLETFSDSTPLTDPQARVQSVHELFTRFPPQSFTHNSSPNTPRYSPRLYMETSPNASLRTGPHTPSRKTEDYNRKVELNNTYWKCYECDYEYRNTMEKKECGRAFIPIRGRRCYHKRCGHCKLLGNKYSRRY